MPPRTVIPAGYQVVLENSKMCGGGEVPRLATPAQRVLGLRGKVPLSGLHGDPMCCHC